MQKNIDKLLSRYPDKYPKDIIDVLGVSMYRGVKVKFVQAGPHIAMYGVDDDKFIKFLNKEEKKVYGLDRKENQYDYKPSDHLPWD